MKIIEHPLYQCENCNKTTRIKLDIFTCADCNKEICERCYGGEILFNKVCSQCYDINSEVLE